MENIKNKKLYNCNTNKVFNGVNLNPMELKFFKNLTEDAFSGIPVDNSFIVFKSINDILYLIYTNKNNSIISYDIVNNKMINEIKKAHNKDITLFRYYLDKIAKKELIISISYLENNLKLWNIINFQCLINIQNLVQNEFIISTCFINDNNNIFILISYLISLNDSESIRVYDINGNKIKEINYPDNNNDKVRTYYIETYYEKKLNKNYIITGNLGYIKSYDYNQNKIYHKYNDNDNCRHLSLIINNMEDIVKLIDSSEEGNIKIWDFHSGLLLNKIKIIHIKILGICLWSNDYLLVGCNDRTIKIIDLRENKIIKDLTGHNERVLTIKKIIHPLYGECLISKGIKDDQIKFWVNKNKINS